MTFVPPLQLETWFIQIFSGNPDIFLGIALMFITSMAALFRMNGIALFLMLGIFSLMFASFVQSPLLILGFIFTGLIIGYWLNRIFIQ